MKIPYVLSFFLFLSGITFSQQSYDEILREIDLKKRELDPYYTEKRNEYKTKHEVINQNYNTKVKEINSQITIIDAKIKVLEDEFFKYRKQSELYYTVSSFYNENSAKKMILYTNLSDLKKIKKVYVNDQKGNKLIFAVWASDYSSNDREKCSRNIMLFWGDSTISIVKNFNSYIPWWVCKIKEEGIKNYNSSNYISSELNLKLFDKMVNYLNFEKAREIKLKIDEWLKEKNSLAENQLQEKRRFENEISKYSIDSLQFHRMQDSIKLLEFENFYKSEIKKQIEINKLIPLNYSKYKTKNVNGVELFNTPLTTKEFRNGDQILLARTQSEWEKFLKSNTPAYKYKDFDEKNASYGFIYNYHAYIDSREIAPYGYHKINLQDYNYLENQVVFNATILENCNRCSNGKEDIYEWCSHCKYWSKEQRKYNVCRYCNNNSLKITGKKKCTDCNGTMKVNSLILKNREIPIYPGSSVNNGLWMDGFVRYYFAKVNDDGSLTEISERTLYSTKYSQNVYIWDTTQYDWGEVPGTEFQIFICKDREILNLNSNYDSKQIGNLEIMSDFLNGMNVTTFKNGDPIKYIDDPIEWELAMKNKIPAYSYYMYQPNSNWIIYNDIALNDPRGIIPNGWRKITHADELHLSFSIGFKFDSRSQFVYGKNEFPGSILLVRDARIKSNLQFLKKHTLHMGELFRSKDLNLSVSNKNIQDYISKSKLQFSNDADWQNNAFHDISLPNEKAYVTEYLSYYNNSGVDIIKTIVESNFNFLFQENPKFKVIGLSEILYCKNGKFEKFSTYDEHILGLIIEPGLNDNEIICTYMYKNCGFYDYKEEKNNGKETSTTFFRSGDFTYTSGNGINLTFHFIPVMNCNPSNNPLENLVIQFDRCYGKNKNWLTTEVISDPYGDFRKDVFPHIQKINQFFENYN